MTHNNFDDHENDDHGGDRGGDQSSDWGDRGGGLSPVFAGEWEVVDGASGPAPAAPVARMRNPRGLVPGWLRTGAGRRATVGAALRRLGVAVWFQVRMLPVYWWRLARQAPAGIVRGLGAWWRFTADVEGVENLRAVRSHQAEGARGTVEVLADQHRQAIRNHLIADVVALAVIVIGALVGWALAPWWARGLLVVGVPVVGLAVLGAVGRDKSIPIVERWISNGVVVPKLTEGLIVGALRDARISGMDKAFKNIGDRAIRWLVPPVRLSSGDGYECVLDLPSGVSVSQAIRAEEQIAAGLSRPTSTVWMSQVAEEEGGHAGRMRMVVTDTPMRGATIPAWPLADPDSGAADIFAPIPLGVNYLGQTVTATLMFRSMIIGAIPRMGKTFTLRLLALAAALDPTVELHLYDLKGGVDFKPLGTKVAHSFGSSQDERIAPDVLGDLRRMVRDMTRRYDTLNRLVDDAPERCPEGKITRDLANDPTLGLHPVLLAIDETQTCFVDWSDHKEFTALVTKLAKMGPAVGIIVICATQSVNGDTIPRSISVTAGLRFCLKVTDHTENDQILGTGAYGKGWRASDLSTDDMGMGYYGGEGADIQLVRCFFVDGATAQAVADRAHALRLAAGRLTGLAAGEDNTEPGIAYRMAAVWPDGRGRMSYADLAALLAAQWPDLCGGWEAEQVSAAGRAVGLDPVQVKHEGRNLWGFRHADVLAALTDSDQPEIFDPEPEPEEEDPDELVATG